MLLSKFKKTTLIGLVGRVCANGLGDLGLIPGRVIPKTLKMVLDTSLLNTQQYKVRIKCNVRQSRERSSVLPYTCVVAIEKGANFIFTLRPGQQKRIVGISGNREGKTIITCVLWKKKQCFFLWGECIKNFFKKKVNSWNLNLKFVLFKT